MPLFFNTFTVQTVFSMNHIHPLYLALVLPFFFSCLGSEKRPLWVFQNTNQTRAVLQEPDSSPTKPCLTPTYSSCVSFLVIYTCLTLQYTQTTRVLPVQCLFMQVKFTENAILLVTVHFVNIFTLCEAHLHILHLHTRLILLFSTKCRIKVLKIQS